MKPIGNTINDRIRGCDYFLNSVACIHEKNPVKHKIFPLQGTCIMRTWLRKLNEYVYGKDVYKYNNMTIEKFFELCKQYPLWDELEFKFTCFECIFGEEYEELWKVDHIIFDCIKE